MRHMVLTLKSESTAYKVAMRFITPTVAAGSACWLLAV